MARSRVKEGRNGRPNQRRRPAMSFRLGILQLLNRRHVSDLSYEVIHLLTLSRVVNAGVLAALKWKNTSWGRWKELFLNLALNSTRIQCVRLEETFSLRRLGWTVAIISIGTALPKSSMDDN